MPLNQSRLVTISITSSLIKVAQLTRAGTVEKLVQRPVSSGGAEASLRDALTGFQLKNAGTVCVLPGDVATTKYLEVPSSSKEEIESILALQASRYTPFNKDEILTSYIKIGSPRPNFSSVLLIVVKRDSVKEKLSILRGAGLSMDAVLFAPEAMARFYARDINLKKGEKFALVDVGSQHTTFIIVADGVPIMSRNIPVGIENITVDPGVQAQIVAESRASVEAFLQETSSRPRSVILTTDHPATAGLEVSLAEALDCKVESIPYGRFVRGVKGVKEQLVRDFVGESALDVIAVGAMAGKCVADLVPQEIKDQRLVVEKGRETMKAGIFILLILAFVGAGLLSRVYFKELFLKQNLIERYSDQKKEVGLLENMISKTRALTEYLQARQVPLEAIRELYRLVPDEMYLSSIIMDDAGSISLAGISESMSQVFSFVTALEESSLFENVKTKSTSAKKERGKDVAAFEIMLKLSSIPDAPAQSTQAETGLSAQGR